MRLPTTPAAGRPNSSRFPHAYSSAGGSGMIELRQLLAPGVERRGAHRRGRGSAEAGERRDGAVRCLQRRRRRLEGGRERAEPDGADAGQLRERQVGG